MSYKKLLSILAVSSLTLVACGEENSTEEPSVEESEQTSEETADSSDVFERAAERETGDATVSVGLEVVGQWTTDGYVVPSEGPTANIYLTAIPAGDGPFFIYVTDEEGKIVEKYESEPEVVHTIENVDSDIHLYAGTSEEDLGNVDDTVNPEEDFVRFEKIIVQPGEVPAEEDAE